MKTLNWIERNLTRSQIATSSTKFVFFWADRKNKIAALASDKLRYFRLLLWNRWTEFNVTWQEARSQRPLLRLWFSSRSEKQDGRPGLWLAETFSTSPLKPLNEIQLNWKGSKISTSPTKFVFWADRKNKMAALASDWLIYFRLSSETAEGIQLNWKGSKISTSPTKFVFFWADRKNKIVALASDWLRYFRLLLWNCWTEFNETWQEARSLRPLPSLCFWADQKNKMAALASDWLRYFRLLLWNRWTEFNETWQEARSLRPLLSLCFRADQKTRWPPWPLICWDVFDFSSETAIWNSTTLDRNQDLNVPYQVCAFLGRSEKQDGRPGLWLAETFLTSPLKPLKQDLNLLYQVYVFWADR